MTITLTVISSFLGLTAAALCGLACWRLRDTTFAAPCAWAAAALACLAAVQIAAGVLPPRTGTVLADHLRYLAGVSVVAPFVALLGAKRPQNTAWQWIVLSLLVLLAFQDLRSGLIEAAPPSPHQAWRWLLAALLVMQLCNYVATYYWAPACLAFAGQWCVLGDYLPLSPEPAGWLFSLGIGMLSLAVVLAGTVRRRWRSADGWQAAWLEFRDTFGALWALRVGQRVNAIAEEQQFALRLSWYGLSPPALDAADATSAPLASPDRGPPHRALRSVLSRFVSARWFPQ